MKMAALHHPAPEPQQYSGKAFAGQMAVVTGASSGIGHAIALALAAQGADLCLVGRKPRALEQVAQGAEALGSQAFVHRVDLSAVEEIEKFAARVAWRFGRVDILIHSAGVISLGPMTVASIESLDWQFGTNVRAPYVLTKALLPALRLSQGQIAFINSSAGVAANANAGQYAATKHALRAIADSLRQEINAEGIRVLSVFVGRTATPLQAAVHASEGRPYFPDRLIQPQDVAAAVINALSLPKTAEVTAVHMRPFSKLG